MVALNFGQHNMLGQPLAETPEMLRKRWLADRALVDWLEIEADLQGTPFLRATVTNGTSGTIDVIVEKRRKVEKAA